jgi:UDP-2,3-diacylglucosamine hydrolase
MTSLGILAGGGQLPLMIADSARGRGEAVHIVGIEGEADPAIARFSHSWVNWGQIGRMVTTLRDAGGRRMVIAGAVTRPDLRRIRVDAGFFGSLPQILRLLAGGDDAVLSRVVRFFENQGFEVLAVHDVAPDLLAAAGRLGAIELGEADRTDAEIGFAVRRALGPVDAGQAVVVVRERVLAIEGPEGTDAMLRRVAAFGVRAGTELAGVLAKGPKPGQELRVDMPVIGPRTVEQAAAAGLAGLAVEAGSVLVLDKAEVVRIADARACALLGLPAGPMLSRVPAAGPPGLLGRKGRVVGRLRPTRRDVRDVEAGLAAVENLAPFQTGRGAVVVRRYIRAIEAAEGTVAMLARAASLRRQWGLRWRRAGVFVRRADLSTHGPPLGSLFAQVAAQELAGIAVSGTATALGAYEDAGRQADDLGLFLVLCETA